jgi:hypothetical protein
MTAVKRSTLDYWASRKGSMTWQLREEGRAEGRAESLLRIVDRRGIALSGEQRDRVLACADIDQLDRWFDRAITAATAAEIFGVD